MPAARDETHFGRRTVSLDEKQGLVDAVFHSVASRYDVMNDLMSFGLHRAWKDALVAKARPSLTRPFAHIDVAGGTGDVAMRVARAGGPLTTVTVVDVNGDMLRVAEERAARRSLLSQAHLRRGQRGSAAARRFALRRLYDRLRHPQRAAHRGGAQGGPSRAQARRAFPLPRILARRCAGARAHLRRLFLRRHSGHRQGGHRRRRRLSLSGRIDPQISASRAIRGHDRGSGLRSRGLYPPERGRSSRSTRAGNFD